MALYYVVCYTNSDTTPAISVHADIRYKSTRTGRKTPSRHIGGRISVLLNARYVDNVTCTTHVCLTSLESYENEAKAIPDEQWAKQKIVSMGTMY
jgi:hypothetical protein